MELKEALRQGFKKIHYKANLAYIEVQSDQGLVWRNKDTDMVLASDNQSFLASQIRRQDWEEYKQEKCPACKEVDEIYSRQARGCHIGAEPEIAMHLRR